jgi:hypothetical protein
MNEDALPATVQLCRRIHALCFQVPTQLQVMQCEEICSVNGKDFFLLKKCGDFSHSRGERNLPISTFHFLEWISPGPKREMFWEMLRKMLHIPGF